MFYLVIDLEMCKVPRDYRSRVYKYANETIQIGAVLLDEEFKRIGTICQYVHPEYGVIDHFIENLTGIRNSQVKKAPKLQDALIHMIDWIGNREYKIYAWSESDRDQILHEIKAKKINDIRINMFINASKWVDYQEVFTNRFKLERQISLEEALERTEVEPEGRFHDGLDDAVNTGRLIAKNLLGEVQYGEIPDLHIELDYTVQPFSKVEDEYLLLFEKYSGTTAPKTIYLEDIAEAFDECMDGWVQFLNVCTGEIVSLSEDPYMACEEDKELWEVIEETDDYVRLPDQYELREKQIMEDFAYETGNARVTEILDNALRRRHPYRGFKDKINELGISQIYYDYRNEAYIHIAEEWCRDHGIPYRQKNICE